MKNGFKRVVTALLLLIAITVSLCPASLAASSSYITTTPTGYTSASQVDYVKSGSYVLNWGARGEAATFLSTYAENFYTGNYTYDKLSAYSGGTTQSNASSSTLYNQLKTLMKSKHSHETSCNETQNQYKYTDCVRSNSSQISSFYSGKTLSGTWDGGSTWNREHTWPNSKGLGGNDENDIMMLRPTAVSENSSRGNTAYGEGSSYYDPGESTRGDVARIVLYVYVRWGNTSKMWGSGGVMENVDVLLNWMEEDPVDTWEMGRNDAVQSITGTRNVFVDYPEFAFLLFGRDMPSDMTTPSGEAKDGSGAGTDNPTCQHTSTELRGVVEMNCGTVGYTGDTYCTSCGTKVGTGHYVQPNISHQYGEIDETGYRTCSVCGGRTKGEVIDPSTCTHKNTEIRNGKQSCTENGYSGDTYCQDCGTLLVSGTVTFPAHDWKALTDTLEVCTLCGEGRKTPTEGGNVGATVAIVGGSVGGVSGIAVALFFFLRKKPV